MKRTGLLKITGLIVALVAVGACAVLWRFDCRPELPAVLDRWTGELTYCFDCRLCESKAPSAPSAGIYDGIFKDDLDAVPHT